MADSSAASALLMLANVAADAPRAPKRVRYTRTALDNVDHGNLALRLRQSDFGERYERVHRPLRTRADDAYAYAVGSGLEARLDPDHGSLLGAPTPAPSPSGRRSLVYDHESEEGDEDEEIEHEDKTEEQVGEEEVNEEERDDQPATQFPVTVVERHHEDEVHTNGNI
jgi:hypothetical protein